MTRCVNRCGGIVDKFIGDAVMALFPRAEGSPNPAESAAYAALLMTTELQHFNWSQPAPLPELQIGIGLHYGPVIAGLIGSPQKRSYTVLGDTVNTAARLEGVTKTLGAEILVSAAFAKRLSQDTFLLRPLGRYQVKGRNASTEVFELHGENDGSLFAGEVVAEIKQCKAALRIIDDGDLNAAATLFDKLARETPSAHRSRGYAFLYQQLMRQQSPRKEGIPFAIELHQK
jgi:hypothetical protein